MTATRVEMTPFPNEGRPMRYSNGWLVEYFTKMATIFEGQKIAIFDTAMPADPNTAPGVSPMGVTGVLAFEAIDPDDPKLVATGTVEFTPVRTGTMQWGMFIDDGDTYTTSTTAVRAAFPISAVLGTSGATTETLVISDTTTPRPILVSELFVTNRLSVT
jgi:hypothetical protein